MSRQITQPVNQVRLTNVAVVRINKSGKRFEVACYRNKVLNYRQGTETDISEVLQTDRVFTNVSKGQFAKSSDLKKAFGTSDQEEISRTILLKGDLQVSDRERDSQIQNTLLEIASMVASRCVDPRSNRPYTVSVIRDAIKKTGFRVNDKRSVKQQFLECVKLIKESGVLSIERARMELRAAFEGKGGVIESVEGILQGVDGVEVAKCDGSSVTILADPSLYRKIDGIVKDNGGHLGIVRQCVTEEGDVNLESEMQRIDRITTAATATGQEEIAELLPSPNQHEEAHDSSGNGESSLLKKMDQLNVNDNDDDDDEPMVIPPSNSRKDRKKAQKKSKKAKRREKEDAADRQERIRKEEVRQEERRQRLALDDDAAPSESLSCTPVDAVTEEKKSCNTCGGSFTLKQYRAHFRSDWHRYNIKLKMKGIPPISEEEFRTCDVDAFFHEVE
mmetsp:Transcript_29609/g.36035  ORF Transcript_29609/g.36035 Transcript_29609/m.36035 type:complete len:447 (+) Transcript_29609:85-1425(+)|eukprot:CAMPEP_0172492772 /NCGR_PEP_ID=MMETSP1066-20121228/24018_1 /TAXON_ID=671091 /ORGANISM="Coscinodiscus wailesii, Strain CCMP2513" /LENGTH=446 /DNA_ID=CAMNT_0013262575 /DNA_START=85 /DNA_END=1425 /DNA_ORIENTATION=+